MNPPSFLPSPTRPLNLPLCMFSVSWCSSLSSWARELEGCFYLVLVYFYLWLFWSRNYNVSVCLTENFTWSMCLKDYYKQLLLKQFNLAFHSNEK